MRTISRSQVAERINHWLLNHVATEAGATITTSSGKLLLTAGMPFTGTIWLTSTIGEGGPGMNIGVGAEHVERILDNEFWPALPSSGVVMLNLSDVESIHNDAYNIDLSEAYAYDPEGSLAEAYDTYSNVRSVDPSKVATKMVAWLTGDVARNARIETPDGKILVQVEMPGSDLGHNLLLTVEGERTSVDATQLEQALDTEFWEQIPASAPSLDLVLRDVNGNVISYAIRKTKPHHHRKHHHKGTNWTMIIAILVVLVLTLWFYG
jgi:hypothetical protein